MNKMAYQKPWAELVQFENEDVVNTSKEASCTAQTGCSGGCDNRGWDGLGVCACGIHSGSQMTDWDCVWGAILGSSNGTYWCHGSLEQGMANAGVSSSSGKRTFSEDYSMGLEDGFGEDTENWD